MATDKPHSKFPRVYGVVRIDFPFDESSPSNGVSLVKVARSEAVAVAEVTRLNRINADRKCKYMCCTSRLID